MPVKSRAQQAFLAINKRQKFGQEFKKGLSIKAPVMPKLIEAHKMRGQKTFRVK